MTDKMEQLKKLNKDDNHQDKVNIDNRSKRNNHLQTGVAIDFEDAERLVKDELILKKMSERTKKLDEEPIQDKSTLRNKKKIYREVIREIVITKKINVMGYEDDREAFIEHMVSEQAGYSILEDAFNDEEISDIFVISYDTIFVEKNGKNIPYHKTFKDEEHYRRVYSRWMDLLSLSLNKTDNRVDFVLYGDRGQIVHSDIAVKGVSITLRKHKEEHIILNEMLSNNLMSLEMKEFFKLIVDGETNVVYAGVTGSGKTTSLRAILDEFITLNGRRTLTCEDTEELFLKNKHTLSLVTVHNDKEKDSVDLRELIKMALRQKPKYIVVGEVRGLEAESAIEAMATGHSTFVTMHAGTPIDAINRFTTKYVTALPDISASIAERTISSAIDFIVIQDDIQGIGRRISSITEVSYDFENSKTRLRTIFEFDFLTNEFKMVNKLRKEKGNKLLRKGQNLQTVQSWTVSDNAEQDRLDIEKANENYHNSIPEREAQFRAYKKLRKKEREEKAKAIKDQSKL